MDMDLAEIEQLIRIVKETGIAELEIQRGDKRVKIRGNTLGGGQDIVLPTVVPVPVSAPAAAVTTVAPAASLAETPVTPPPPARSDDDRNTVVKSPIVGTYYDAPAPASPPFVKVGDQIHPKQVLCIIESMKLMNEIEAEVAGTLIAKFVENGRPVEYGESLFTIRPL